VEGNMKVKCIDNCHGTYPLTISKEYEVNDVRGSGKEWFCLTNDFGECYCYFASNFEIVKEEKEMKEFLNENKRQFKDLTDEEKLLIVNEKMKGNVEYTLRDVWCKASDWEVNFKYVYRTKPAKKLDIPWKFIKPEFKWVAMDKDGEIYLHIDKPAFGSWNWVTNSGYCRIDQKLNIDTTGVDWKTSLTERPDGV